MAKTHKRVLSLILSLVMVLSLLPIQALAAVSISCTASDGAVITVTGDIPENAVVTAVPVPVELEGMKTLGAYDINITVDGAAWQPESPVEVADTVFLANSAVAPGSYPQLTAGKFQFSLGHAPYDQNHSATTFSVSTTAARITSSQTVTNHPAKSPVKPPNTFNAIRL